jgi:hypothetical protein
MRDPNLRQRAEQISEILENVWNVGKLTSEEYKIFENCIQTPVGRKLFRGQLNKYRISHRKLLEPKSFNLIKQLFWKVLDKMRDIDKQEYQRTNLEISGRKPSFFEDPTRERLETCMD